jgi:hypothetical protein
MISSSYILFLNHQIHDSSFDLSLQFNGYPIGKLKLNCKKLLLYGYRKENFIESKKKEIVAFK